jgi:hypothetical protein
MLKAGEAAAAAGAAAAGGSRLQRWLTASSSQSLSSAHAVACMEEVPLPGSQDAKLAVLCCGWPAEAFPPAPLLKVAAEAGRMGVRAGMAGKGLCLQETSSGSVVLRVQGCAEDRGAGMHGGEKPTAAAAAVAAAPWLGTLLVNSPAVSSLGAGNSKGSVLRLMPHSLSTGAAVDVPAERGTGDVEGCGLCTGEVLLPRGDKKGGLRPLSLAAPLNGDISASAHDTKKP